MQDRLDPRRREVEARPIYAVDEPRLAVARLDHAVVHSIDRAVGATSWCPSISVPSPSMQTSTVLVSSSGFESQNASRPSPSTSMSGRAAALEHFFWMSALAAFGSASSGPSRFANVASSSESSGVRPICETLRPPDRVRRCFAPGSHPAERRRSSSWSCCRRRPSVGLDRRAGDHEVERDAVGHRDR